MNFYKVKKRNGAIVDFDRNKIYEAIKKAIQSVGGSDFSKLDEIVDESIEVLSDKVEGSVPNIEKIQDSVEQVLIKRGHDKVAKSYITYRHQRQQARKDKEVIIQVQDTIEEYLDKLDWRINENSNQTYSLGGMILNTNGKVTANYWLSHIYPSDIGNLHRNGDLHIHDLSMFCGYCAGWSLRKLLEEGLNGVPSKVESAPPKNLQSAVNQMVNFLGTLQNEWAGAQAFSSVDTYLAPFVHKYKQSVKDDLKKTNASFESEQEKQDFIDKKVYEYVHQNFQNLVWGLNTPSRWGTQTPFTNITLDWVCPPDLKDKALHMGGYDAGEYDKKYSELEDEMRLINKVLIEIYTSGDRNNRIFTFPIPTYNVTEDFPWDDPLVEDLFEMTAKYGLPYFQNFVGSQYKWIEDEDGNKKKIKDENAYKPGSVRSMCCRLQLDLDELKKRGGGLFGSAEMTGSIGVVTLNMPRIGYNNKGDKEGFKQRVDYLMEKAKTSLEIKRKEVKKWLDRGLYPYTKRYLERGFQNHFSTIGLNGMNEAIENFTDGKEDITTQWGQDFALEVMDFMRKRLKQYQEETGNLYNLEATPAEGTTHRFAKEDIKQHKDIIHAGTEKGPYYTNSTQLPVDYTDDVFEALDKQDELQCKYTGGTVFHNYLGEKVSDGEACKKLVKKMLENYRMPYVTISPTFSICPEHGYIEGEHDFCPKCDEQIGYVGQKQDMDIRSLYTTNDDKLKRQKQKKIG